jgi:hypothetical protein
MKGLAAFGFALVRTVSAIAAWVQGPIKVTGAP